ncbi:MAG: hypothetical protein COA36_17645 [Desulfotalea sp.]|nr:MAG: hypothetical protein COA36_17645 [Desulfotalea sp.]
MKNSITLLNKARGIIPPTHDTSIDIIQAFLASRTSLGISEMAQDYARHKGSLSTRVRALLARSIFEGSTRIICALKSHDLALNLYVNANKDDLKRCKQLEVADGGSSGSSLHVVQLLDFVIESIEQKFPNFIPKNISAFSLAKEAGCELHYRTLYFELSRYVHHNPHSISDEDDPGFAGELEAFVITSCCATAEAIAKHYEHPDRASIIMEAHKLVSETE